MLADSPCHRGYNAPSPNTDNSWHIAPSFRSGLPVVVLGVTLKREEDVVHGGAGMITAISRLISGLHHPGRDLGSAGALKLVHATTVGP
jgi:hypothetical protein